MTCSFLVVFYYYTHIRLLLLLLVIASMYIHLKVSFNTPINSFLISIRISWRPPLLCDIIVYNILNR